MKKAKGVIGEVVQVPVYEFAPCRRGWNGWLFSTGIIRDVYTSKTGRKCYQVEYVNRHSKDGSSITKGFVSENVFDASLDIAHAKQIIDEYTREQFDNATGVNWILFLSNNGIVNLK